VALDLGPTATVTSIAIDLSGKFAYVTDSANSTLRQFQISALNGALSPVASPLSYSAAGIALDPKGSFAFTADSSDNTISIFSIDTTNGALTYGNSVPAGTNPVAIATDYSGDFVRVATGNGELLTFRLDRDAPSLTLVDTETGGGATAEPATIVTSSHAE
jgi:6-phosphogluconolactonase (cycloisomerase 2 family)